MSVGKGIDEVLKEAVHDLYRWRGTIVGGLAQLESTFVDASVQINDLAPYTGTLTKYPESGAKAIAYIEGILALPGPLSSHDTSLRAIFREFETESVNRNLFAHGIMTLQHSPNEPLLLDIKLWHHKPKVIGKGAMRRLEQFLWDDVRLYADRVSDLADRGMALFNLMYQLHHFGGSDNYTP